MPDQVGQDGVRPGRDRAKEGAGTGAETGVGQGRDRAETGAGRIIREYCYLCKIYYESILADTQALCRTI